MPPSSSQTIKWFSVNAAFRELGYADWYFTKSKTSYLINLRFHVHHFLLRVLLNSHILSCMEPCFLPSCCKDSFRPWNTTSVARILRDWMTVLQSGGNLHLKRHKHSKIDLSFYLSSFNHVYTQLFRDHCLLGSREGNPLKQSSIMPHDSKFACSQDFDIVM